MRTQSTARASKRGSARVAPRKRDAGGVWLDAQLWGDTRTVCQPPASTIHGMNTAAHRQRLANFIDLALTPWTLYGRPIAAVPIPRSVLATCGEEMHALADA